MVLAHLLKKKFFRLVLKVKPSRSERERPKTKGWARVYKGRSNNIMAEIAALVLDKVEFRPRCMKQEKPLYNA